MHPRDDLVLVLASNNAGKAAELRELLDGSDWRLVTVREANVRPPAVIEGGRSYLENATIKAVAVAREAQLPALADDSGIEVDALGGAPNVVSARYGGPRVLDDRARWQYLLKQLEGVPRARRTARFRAVLVLALPSGRNFSREGMVEGRIAESARGEGGFGYDSVFEVPDGRTMAELGPEKQLISHRARAMRAMMDVLQTLARESGARGPDAVEV